MKILKATLAVQALASFILFASLESTAAFTPITTATKTSSSSILQSASSINTIDDTTWFPSAQTNTNDNNNNNVNTTSLSKSQLKAQILQLGAALDRGQAYNPTSGAYYSGTMLLAKKKVQELIQQREDDVHVPTSLADMEGEWELVFTSVPHGIFRSSPFFLAIQEAFQYGEEKGMCLL